VARRTVLHRLSVRRTVSQLAIGVNEEYLRGLLGIPIYGSTSDGRGWLAWDLDYLHVGVVVASGKVDAFTITLVDPLFRFDCDSLTFGFISGPLGRATFEAQADETPSGQVFHLGARRVSYCESHYFGNPGKYLTFLLGYSDASSAGCLELPRGGMPSGHLATGMYARSSATDDVAPRAHVATDDALAFLRRTGRPNTLSVLGVGVDLEQHDWAGAIDLDTSRLRSPRRGTWRSVERTSVQLSVSFRHALGAVVRHLKVRDHCHRHVLLRDEASLDGPAT
jgi:hypothetical protein